MNRESDSTRELLWRSYRHRVLVHGCAITLEIYGIRSALPALVCEQCWTGLILKSRGTRGCLATDIVSTSTTPSTGRLQAWAAPLCGYSHGSHGGCAWEAWYEDNDALRVECAPSLKLSFQAFLTSIRLCQTSRGLEMVHASIRNSRPLQLQQIHGLIGVGCSPEPFLCGGAYLCIPSDLCQTFHTLS